MLALALALGVAIGLALGMLGGGGSILLVPVLAYVLGQSAQEAVTTSLVIVTAAAIAGGAGQARAGNVCWRHAVVFTAAAIPAIVAGTTVGGLVSGRLLLGSFGVLMLAGAYATARRQVMTGRTAPSRCPALRPGWDLGLGALVGFLTGFLGVGGGFLVVPALAVALGFPIRSAVGTSLAVITATGVLGATVHFAAGRTIDLELAAAITAAMVVGSLAGVRIGRGVSDAILARSFAGLVSAVGVCVVLVAALGAPSAG